MKMEKLMAHIEKPPVETGQHLQDSLGFLINGLARLMRSALETRLQDTSLSPTTWTVLVALGEEDGLSQTDLSRRTFLDGATITRTLDQLAELSYIERHRDNIDRRVQKVVLTEKGRKAYQRAVRYGKEVNLEAINDLSAKESREFEENIRRVISRMQNYLNSEGVSGR